MKNFIYDIPTKVFFGKDEELRVGDRLKELTVMIPREGEQSMMM